MNIDIRKIRQSKLQSWRSAIEKEMKSWKSSIGFLRKFEFWKCNFWVLKNSLILVRDFHMYFIFSKSWFLKKSDLCFLTFQKKSWFEKRLRYTVEEMEICALWKLVVFFGTPLTLTNMISNSRVYFLMKRKYLSLPYLLQNFINDFLTNPQKTSQEKLSKCQKWSVKQQDNFSVVKIFFVI